MDSLAQSQIELNKVYGRRLIIIAWTIEIVAASIGLFIGISSAIYGLQFYDEGSMLGNKFTDTFIGAAPFIIIAAVELTKIPLALGFYRTKRLVWRLTFLITLFLLVFVTFETIFNGLERNFSTLESDIEKPRREFQEKTDRLSNIEANLERINSRTTEQLDSDYSIKISEQETERSDQLLSLNNARDEEISSVNAQIEKAISAYGVIADTRGSQQKSDRLRQDIANAQENAKEAIKDLNSAANTRLEEIEVQIGQIDENMTEELLNKGFLQSASAIRIAAKELRDPLVAEKQDLQNELRESISDIENERDEFIREKRAELEVAETELVTAQGRDSGTLQNNIDQLQTRIDTISRSYSSRIDDANALIDKRIAGLEKELEDAKNIQRQRQEDIPELERESEEIRSELVSLEKEINVKARGNNIYRITGRFYDRDSAADILVEELKVVSTIWFGSIALIAALVGPILALAGYVLQDPESYRPILNKKKPIRRALRGVLLRLRIFYKTRRTGVLRRSFRALVVDMRRRYRAPKIKFKEVKVPHEVVKEVQVPGPEKVVYKEVPKEIVKSEIVYVPLYSVEEGTVLSEKDKYKTPKLDDE